LGLFSVATNVGTLGGEYGFRPRDTSDFEVSEESELSCRLTTGSVFWFSFPLVGAPSPVDPSVLRLSTSGQTLVRQDDGVQSAKSAAESITASYKSRPARGNIMVCDTVPKHALRFATKVVPPDRPAVKEADQHKREVTVTNNATTEIKPTSICKKINLKAKSICGGRLSSNMQTVLSLRRTNGDKIIPISISRNIKISKSRTIANKTKNMSHNNKWSNAEDFYVPSTRADAASSMSMDNILEEEDDGSSIETIKVSNYHSNSKSNNRAFDTSRVSSYADTDVKECTDAEIRRSTSFVPSRRSYS
jgi:hypothetical protein